MVFIAFLISQGTLRARIWWTAAFGLALRSLRVVHLHLEVIQSRLLLLDDHFAPLNNGIELSAMHRLLDSTRLNLWWTVYPFLLLSTNYVHALLAPMGKVFNDHTPRFQTSLVLVWVISFLQIPGTQQVKIGQVTNIMLFSSIITRSRLGFFFSKKNLNWSP